MRRNENNMSNFEVVYNFRGKVFVKKERTVGSLGASHIPTNSSLQKFLDHLDMSHTTSQQPTAPPLTWEEIVVLLPSTARKGATLLPSP